jgi:hypothetical protein
MGWVRRDERVGEGWKLSRRKGMAKLNKRKGGCIVTYIQENA